jgi:hypothetical protein
LNNLCLKFVLLKVQLLTRIALLLLLTYHILRKVQARLIEALRVRKAHQTRISPRRHQNHTARHRTHITGSSKAAHHHHRRTVHEHLDQCRFDLSNKKPLTLHLEKIALTTPKISSSKSTDIKAALDTFQTSSSDFQRKSPQLSAQLNTIIHNMHACLNYDGQFLMEYIDKTKEHLKTVKDAQDMLQAHGFEEEVKLQKRVFDSVSDRLEKLEKLQAIFRME